LITKMRWAVMWRAFCKSRAKVCACSRATQF
jgi:hypothetical protein